MCSVLERLGVSDNGWIGPNFSRSREGDKFYRANGDVLQADTNAARNVRNRIHDRKITRYMPHLQVKQILLARSSGATERQVASVGRRKPRQRSADKSNAQL